MIRQILVVGMLISLIGCVTAPHTTRENITAVPNVTSLQLAAVVSSFINEHNKTKIRTVKLQKETHLFNALSNKLSDMGYTIVSGDDAPVYARELSWQLDTDDNLLLFSVWFDRRVRLTQAFSVGEDARLREATPRTIMETGSIK